MLDFSASRIAVGVDVVTISRIQRLLEEYPDRFREFGFTAGERAYCDRQATPSQHYAARWTVKEAFVKAVGKPGVNPELTTIQVRAGPPPGVSVSAEMLESLDQVSQTTLDPDETEVAVSMAHELESDLALGMVVVGL